MNIKPKHDKPLTTPEYFITSEQIDFNIIGLPLKTRYGFIKAIKVKEYPKTSRWIEFLKLEPWEVKKLVTERAKGELIEDDIISDLEDNSLLACIQTNVAQLKSVYGEILSELMPYDYSEDFFYKNVTTQSEFDDLRKLILQFNSIQVREKSQDKEVERYNVLRELMNKAKGKSIDFEAQYTCLCAIGHKPHDINDFTLSQFFGTFKRIELFKLYDTTTLYKTVDSKDKVEIIEWYKSFKDKDEGITYDSVDDLATNNPFLRGK